MTAVRGDSSSLHSTKMSTSGPAPSRAAAIISVARRMAPDSSAFSASWVSGENLKPVKPRRTASFAASKPCFGSLAPRSQWLA
jgi:hypothetical protein